MFKKLKQRIEEGEPPTAVSSPKVVVPKSSGFGQHHGKLYRENKWEKRRVSTASLYSSKESMGSDMTISRSSPTSDFSSPAITPCDVTSLSNKVRNVLTNVGVNRIKYELQSIKLQVVYILYQS